MKIAISATACVLAAAFLAGYASPGMAAGQCSSDAVSDDSCYRLLRESERQCRQADLHKRDLTTPSKVVMQCEQFDGLGRCERAQYRCVGDGRRVIHYGIAVGVRG